jgi:hypothetical protein
VSVDTAILVCDDGVHTRSQTTFSTQSQGMMPTKSKIDEVGYELNLIARAGGRTDDILNDVGEFHTGVILTAPPGFHYEVYGTRELWEAGYMLPSGMMIVPDGEEIIVPLIKFTDKTPDLNCGEVSGVNVILRRNYYSTMVKVTPPSQPQMIPGFYVAPPNGAPYYPQFVQPQYMPQPVGVDRNATRNPKGRQGLM